MHLVFCPFVLLLLTLSPLNLIFANDQSEDGERPVTRNNGGIKIGFESINSQQPLFIGLDYKSDDRRWQRNNEKKKGRNKKSSGMINRFGGNKNYLSREQNKKRKGKGTGKFWRRKGKTNRKQIENTNLVRQRWNLGGGKNRNQKRKIKTTGNGRKNPGNRKKILNRKGRKGAIGRLNLAFWRQISEREHMMRSSILNLYHDDVAPSGKLCQSLSWREIWGWRGEAE